MRPVKVWEGSNLEVFPSERGPIYEPACQLRDPAIYEENNEIYILYSVAGERGIAIAELIFQD